MENEAPNVTPPPSLEPSPTQAPRKRSRLNKWHVVTVVLGVIVIVQALLYVASTMSYNSLNSEHEKLVSEHDALENSYTSLQSSRNSLQSSYDSLSSSYYSLKSDYDSFVSDYNSLRSEVNQRTQQLDVKAFITPNDLAVKNLVLQVTGGWSNPNDWNEYWGDVKAMYDWVVNNIEYRYDGLYPTLPSEPSGTVEYRQEMWQFSSETLNLNKGDCEDVAILLTSMILSYNGGKYPVECIEITGSLGGHVGVQFPVTGNKLTILDQAGNYYTQTWYGSLTSEDVSTEINNWLNHWKPDLGSDVRVDSVFSNTLVKSFSSTSEYVSWMYNR